MATLQIQRCAAPARLLSVLDAPDKNIPVPPAPGLACPRLPRRSPRMFSPCVTSQRSPRSKSSLETLPVEIANQILSYLTHPRSRLPGLTEGQSELPKHVKRSIKDQEDLSTPADSDRWAVDLFSWNSLQHPLHTLSLTSKRCHDLVESYCAHKVKAYNLFNLPFERFDRLGAKSVWPDLSGIVYRRLWLQHAPRLCIFCSAVMDKYPFHAVKRVVAACEACFYAQVLDIREVEDQYHLSTATVRSSPVIRGNPNTVWVLRVDVEALAYQLYGTRAFHHAHPEQQGRPCTICAITKFAPEGRVTGPRNNQKQSRRLRARRSMRTAS
ncbi:hypothetical protein FB567DRAFT_40641 [Paraphoma chrysanthemicola]|uniref:Uncharacterized protein n=1 Tax=Paraphoma chrysanthemicola TaxID=798071 RepID=A0A8K0W4Y3_9PLEO|nr:hypothetical protein FB567DRAFT_40641 [Paraphoma chrysanthemicola]